MDELLSVAAQIGDADLAHFDLAGLDGEMREVIMSAPAVESIPPATETSPPKRRRRLGRRVAAVAVAAALVAVALVVLPKGGNDTSAWAAEVLAVAEASPRLLVDLPGWTVIRADEFTVEYGEMTFFNGERMIDLHWRASDTHDGYVDDRAHSADPPWAITVDGHPATEFRYTGTNDFTTLWLDGEHSLEARGVFPDRASYEAILVALKPTDVDVWLNAMPASVVKPDSRADAIAAMLADIPLPAGFDVTALEANNGVSDRYQLGARVTGAATCAWVEYWIEAKESGDTDSFADAAEAMATSHQWAILREMESDGGYPEVVWMIADAMAAADGRIYPDIPEYEHWTVVNWSDDALGCDTKYPPPNS